MIHAQNDVVGYFAASTANNATASLVVDRQNADYVTFDVAMGTAAATTAPLALIVHERDGTDGDWLVVPGFDGGTGFTIVARADVTATETYARFGIDCLGRRRFLRLSVTPGTTAVVAIRGAASRNDVAPVTAAQAGVTLQKFGN